MEKATKNTIPIFFAVDDNYIPQLAVALRSLIDNSSGKNYYEINVLVDKLSEDSRTAILDMQESNVSISFVSVTERLASICRALHIRDYYTNTTYYRFFIPEMFPQYDKGIYLDCDIVITCDIAKMYRYSLGSRLAGVITDEIISDIDVFANYSEVVLGISRWDYFNAGIMLMNLDAMRKMHIEERFAQLLGERTFAVAQDQDYLNVLCQNNLRHLSKSWNKTPLPSSDPKKVPYIIHYKINFKPWRYDGIVYGEYFWKYAKRTPYYRYFANMKAAYTDEQKLRDQKQYDALADMARLETENELKLQRAMEEMDLISFDFFDLSDNTANPAKAI